MECGGSFARLVQDRVTVFQDRRWQDRQWIVAEEIGKEMMERVSVYRDLLSRTPVDELEVREHPRVIFRVDEMTWIDAIVRYLVAARGGTRKKSFDSKTTRRPQRRAGEGHVPKRRQSVRSPSTSSFKFCSAGERLLERQFVGRFQTCTRRQTARNARERDRFVFQKIDKVGRGRLAFDIDSERENDLGKFFFLDAIQEFFDPQIFRADVIQRRNAAA